MAVDIPLIDWINKVLGIRLLLTFLLLDQMGVNIVWNTKILIIKKHVGVGEKTPFRIDMMN